MEMNYRKAASARFLLFFLGMIAMSVQVIMIREFLAVSHGNELVIGLFLGIWMVLTAAGAFLSIPGSRFRDPGSKSKIENRKSKIENPFSPLLLFSFPILPLATLFLLVILRFSLVPAGVMPGLGQTALILFLSLLPFCLFSGMLFPFFVQCLSTLKGKNLLHEGYTLDAAGSILGGLLFSVLFIFILPPYESLLWLTIFCMVLLIIWFGMTKRKLLTLSVLLFGISIIILNLTYKPVRFLDKLQFSRQEVIEIKSSPYGMIAVTCISDHLFMYENGMPVNIGDDPVTREESVHYAMLLHNSPLKGLAIAGGMSGIIEEILKYPVLNVDYVDTDPWMIRVAGRYRPLPVDQRVNYIFKDPRIFLKMNDDKYDFILINTPEPFSVQLDRFYTQEFYRLLKEKLNPGGIISVSVPAAGHYMNETSRRLHSVSYNTLKAVFSYIRIIPGGKDYFLASDSSLNKSIFRNYPSSGFTNLYVDPSYINEDLLKMRSDLILKDILADAPVNSDLKPYVFSLFLRQWLERFKINTWLIPLVLIMLLILSLIFFGPLNLGLFTGGFTASGLEFILLIWFQVMYGYVYLMTGVIFAVFMIGIASGSLFRQRIFKSNTFRGYLTLQGAIATFSVIIAAMMLFIPTLSANKFLFALVFILLFITGLLTGIQFSLSAYLRKSEILKSSGESFSADLFGSAIGILLVSVYIIPQLGLPVTGLLLAGLNVVVLGVMAVKGRYLST
jgi:spermidine synthase